MKKIMILLSFVLLPFVFLMQTAFAKTAANFPALNKMSVSYEANFSDHFHDDWIVEMEQQPDSNVYTKNNTLILNTKGGVTVWLKKPLSGNYLISYKRRFTLANGANDRLSDLNQFWIAKDPKQQNLFTRTGALAEYDTLDLWYMGMGGNYNSTTRFRHYDGKGNRVLLKEYLDKQWLLISNHEYHVVTEVNNGFTRVWIDGKLFFEHKLKQKSSQGYFGFRSTFSHQSISDFKIYKK
jgi:hypothetical protein